MDEMRNPLSQPDGCRLSQRESQGETDCHASLAMTAPAVLAPHQSGPCPDSFPPGGSLGETDCHDQSADWSRNDRFAAAADSLSLRGSEATAAIRVPEEQRITQLKRLSGILIDRLEEAVEGKDFSVKEIRTYTNTLMDLRQIQMTDPELIAREQELKLIKLRREAGELGPRQLRISFEGAAERASE